MLNTVSFCVLKKLISTILFERLPLPVLAGDVFKQFTGKDMRVNYGELAVTVSEAQRIR